VFFRFFCRLRGRALGGRGASFFFSLLPPDDKQPKTNAGKMTLSDDVSLEEFVLAKDELSGADIKAVCTEAGLLALRERRMRVTQADFRKAKEKVLYKKKEGVPEGLYM
jgi:ATP-dependent 26S proteasome regulatory subunit